jgi:hypothetical protein
MTEGAFDPNRKPISVSDDPLNGTLTIEGVKYTYELFRALGPLGMRAGQTFRLTERFDNGQPIISIVTGD